MTNHISMICRKTARGFSKRPVIPRIIMALLLTILMFSNAGCSIYARWLHVKGTRLDLDGRFDSAAVYYRAAVDEDPDLVQPRLQLANYYYWKRQFSDAEREYMAVLERDPENVRATKALTQSRLHLLGGVTR